jgi:hypothetical protein
MKIPSTDATPGTPARLYLTRVEMIQQTLERVRALLRAHRAAVTEAPSYATRGDRATISASSARRAGLPPVETTPKAQDSGDQGR